MFEYRVIVTGSREYDNYDKLDDVLYWVWHDEVLGHGKLVVIAGGAQGADTLAERSVAGNTDVARMEVYPADWDRLGKAAGPIRNQQMLDTGADLVLAFYKTGAKNIGTQDMVNRAEKAGIKVKKYYD